MRSSILAPCSASTWLSAALLTLVGALGLLIDLTGCEAADITSRADGQVVVILWTCPDQQSWSVRYQATGARPALLAKPAPSPTPTP